jgi:glucose-1-phosphate thymidylyltransferase
MKGIVLAGGTGSRLSPSTSAICKQLIPIYDKPMVYYPISVLMMAGIKDILIISTPRDLPLLEHLLGTGENFGVRFEYAVQVAPKGIAEAFVIGKKFIGEDSVALILGDNLFYGNGLFDLIQKIRPESKATIFGYHVKNPQHYGVLEFDGNNKIVSIEEKPKDPKSSFAVPGIYFYPNDVVFRVNSIKPSPRGELEITTLNEHYLNTGDLDFALLPRGVAWLDTGTADDLLSASNFVQAIEHRQGYKIACLEEIALRKGFLSKEELAKILATYPDSPYKKYILDIDSLGVG